jgi:hypothetical protein
MISIVCTKVTQIIYFIFSSGEITENSAQVRKDNPYRKGSDAGKSSGASAGAAYTRIFSDSR